MIPGFGRSPGGGNGSPLQEDLLEGEMTTHSNTLARRMLWTEEPSRLQFMEAQRVRHD